MTVMHLQLAAKGAAMAPSVRRAAARLVLSRVAEAYGRMLLEEGLFQAVRYSLSAVVTQISVLRAVARGSGLCEHAAGERLASCNIAMLCKPTSCHLHGLLVSPGWKQPHSGQRHLKLYNVCGGVYSLAAGLLCLLCVA